MLALLLSGFYVDDLEVFDVVDRVGTEGEFYAVGLLNLQKQVLVLMAQALEVGGMQEDAKADFLVDSIACPQVANDADETALDFDAHGAGGFDGAAAVAIGAIDVGATGMALAVPLAGHLHDPKG